MFNIVEYGDKTPGLENHHGVLDVWATHNIDGYNIQNCLVIIIRH